MTTRVSAQPRHALMDAGRGFAILGILWLNIFIVAIPFAALAIPGIWGDDDPGRLSINFAAWNAVSIIVDGVMRAMIALLFGASALLAMQAADASGRGLVALDPYYRRLLWLIGFGLVHSYLLLWPYDILYLYGLFGLFLFPLRNLGVRTLVTIGIVLVGFSILVGAEKVSTFAEAQGKIERMLDEELMEQGRQSEPLAGWEDSDGSAENETPADGEAGGDGDGDSGEDGFADDPRAQQLIAEIGAEIEIRHGGYIDNMIALAPDSFREQTSEVLSHHFLDVMPLMLFGMALLKCGFLTGAWRTRTYAAIAVAGLMTGWALGRLTVDDFAEGGLLSGLSASLSAFTYDPRRIALALGYFSLLALLLRSGRLKWLLAPLVSCGRLALTLYIGQTIVTGLIFYGYGFGLFGEFEHAEVAGIAALMTIAQMIIATVYLQFFRQGPLEWLLRRLSGAGTALA